MLFTNTNNPVVEIGLKIASVTYGGLLGTFFLGLLFPRARRFDAALGFCVGLAAMIAVIKFTPIDYTWHTIIGCLTTILVANLSSLIRRAPDVPPS
jgi:Na+/proline symporter